MIEGGIIKIISDSGIFISESEINNLEKCDFNLNDFETIGLIVHTYINTERCCAKEIIMLPNQVCPEHKHPNKLNELGKEETFRCRFGTVSIFIEGEPTENPTVNPPKTGREFYTVWKEVVLNKGEQLTLKPNTLHWFKAHGEGAVVSEFSTHSNDASDIFTDPNINRFSML